MGGKGSMALQLVTNNNMHDTFTLLSITSISLTSRETWPWSTCFPQLPWPYIDSSVCSFFLLPPPFRCLDRAEMSRDHSRIEG